MPLHPLFEAVLSVMLFGEMISGLEVHSEDYCDPREEMILNTQNA